MESNFCPQPGFDRHGRRRGDQNRPMARTGGSAAANQGYQGQLLLVAPSQRAVIVRLGQTPNKPGFDANDFGADVLSALR